MRSYDSLGVIIPRPISSHGVDVTCSHKSGVKDCVDMVLNRYILSEQP